MTTSRTFPGCDFIGQEIAAFTIKPYRELAPEFQKAIGQYLSPDAAIWSLREGHWKVQLGYYHKGIFDTKRYWADFLDAYVACFGDQLFCIGEVDVLNMQKAIMELAVAEFYNGDWDLYHQQYLAEPDPGRGVPEDSNEVWPVFLYPDWERDSMIDGWHRFHDYSQKGLARIPAFSFVEDQPYVSSLGLPKEN